MHSLGDCHSPTHSCLGWGLTATTHSLGESHCATHSYLGWGLTATTHSPTVSHIALGCGRLPQWGNADHVLPVLLCLKSFIPQLLCSESLPECHWWWSVVQLLPHSISFSTRKRSCPAERRKPVSLLSLNPSQFWWPSFCPLLSQSDCT